MIHRQLAFLFSAGLLAVATACGQSPDANTTVKKTESTTQTSGGTVTTTSESKQVGTTLEAKSETKTDTSSGTVTSKTETIVGTVTAFTVGKKIEVMTGDKKMHSFNLDDKDVVYSVDPTMAVGQRVTVIDETGADKVHRITVKLGA
jgi:sRNA-binding protein